MGFLGHFSQERKKNEIAGEIQLCHPQHQLENHGMEALVAKGQAGVCSGHQLVLARAADSPSCRPAESEAALVLELGLCSYNHVKLTRERMQPLLISVSAQLASANALGIERNVSVPAQSSSAAVLEYRRMSLTLGKERCFGGKLNIN